MSQKTAVSSILISAVTGFVAAAAMCLVFFFYIYKPAAQTNENTSLQNPPIKNHMSPTQTPNQEIPTYEVKESEIISLNLETVYTGYFEEKSNCRKTYNEFYGDKDGVFSSSSPCNLKLVFNRDGSATKIIEMRRYDKAARGWTVAETTEWRAKISDEQFKSLAKIIAENNAFKNYQDAMVTVSNSKIIVKDSGSPKTVMSNVDEKTTVFLSMMNAFKELEGKVSWKKV